eukprot:m.223515 g.223515  ORF g.223515 m.223515 type:complete len:409 (+) comp10935_c0_seq1:394-1620(+)
MLETPAKFGFVVVDGQTATIATVAGRQRELHATIDSAAKSRSRRGGQSAQRFERLRDGAEHGFVKRVCEAMQEHYVALTSTHDPEAIVAGIFLAGPAGVKRLVLEQCAEYQLLRPLVLGVLDTQHVGPQGLGEAIALSADLRAAAASDPASRLVEQFDDEIARDGLCVYGVAETLAALDAGAVHTVLLDETGAGAQPFTGGGTIAEAIHAAAIRAGADVCVVRPVTPRTAAFCRGFGGIGGLLRWKYAPEGVADDVEDGPAGDDGVVEEAVGIEIANGGVGAAAGHLPPITPEADRLVPETAIATRLHQAAPRAPVPAVPARPTLVFVPAPTLPDPVPPVQPIGFQSVRPHGGAAIRAVTHASTAGRCPTPPDSWEDAAVWPALPPAPPTAKRALNPTAAAFVPSWAY